MKTSHPEAIAYYAEPGPLSELGVHALWYRA
jgi:hypothetical protein